MPEARFSRRHLFTLGGKLAAGAAGAAAGATAAGVGLAGPAGAAAGDPIVLGAANTAGTASTSVTSSSSAGTLAVANSGTGPALAVQGPVTFLRSGTVPIFNPNHTVTVTVPGGLKKTSGAFAMVQNVAWQVNYTQVASVSLNTTDSTITIHLNSLPPYAVKCAWWVFG